MFQLCFSSPNDPKFTASGHRGSPAHWFYTFSHLASTNRQQVCFLQLFQLFQSLLSSQQNSPSPLSVDHHTDPFTESQNWLKIVLLFFEVYLKKISFYRIMLYKLMDLVYPSWSYTIGKLGKTCGPSSNSN